MLITNPITSTCTVTNATDDPFSSGASYNRDTKATCTIQLSDVGGATQANLLDVCSYPSTQPNSAPSDCIIIRNDKGNLTVIKNVVPDNSATNWNFAISGPTSFSVNIAGDGTSGINSVDLGTYSIVESAGTDTSLNNYSTTWACTKNGAPYLSGSGTNATGIVIDKSGNIQDSVVCTFTNTRVNNAKLTIIKDAVPNSAQDFSFTATGTGLSNFSLDDDADATLSNSITFSDLASGTYSVTETPIAGWDLTSATCTDESDPSNIQLGAGEDVTCTFVNTQRGKIIVDKVTEPAGDLTSFEFDPSYTTNFFLADASTPHESDYLVPGTYSVAELTPSDWDLTSATCSDGSTPDNISLQAGETVTCTFNNQKDSKIIIEKQTTPDGSPESFTFQTNYGSNFNLNDGQSNDSGDLVPGTYSVDELTPSGWDETSAVCSDQSPVTAISLQAGETVTCVFSNTQRGKIIVAKQTLPDGDSTTFDFTTSYDEDGFSLSDGQSNDSGYLIPGNYSVSENAETGWLLTSVVCSDKQDPASLALSAGETITCTFTNTKLGSISGFKWNDLDGDGIWDEGEPTLANWLITLTNPDESTTYTNTDDYGYYLFDNLLPGNYGLAEAEPGTWTQTFGSTGVVLSAGDESQDNNFGNFENIDITVCKVEDVDGSTSTEDDRSAVAGWEIDLYKNGQLIDDTRVTGENGCYTWANLGPTATNAGPGSYSVTEAEVAGWTHLGPTTHDFGPAVSGQDESHTFANFKNISLSGYKFSDDNRNGIWDKNLSESALPGWEINLSGTAAGSTTTDDNGYYEFTNLGPGSYTLSETNQDSWEQTYPVNPSTHTVSAVSDSPQSNLNFGNFPIRPGLANEKLNITGGTVLEGETVQFTIEAENTGNVTLYNPIVTDTYDATYLEYVSSSPITASSHTSAVIDSQDYDNDGDTTELIRVLTWNLPDLEPGESYTLTLTFTALKYTAEPDQTGNLASTTACLSDDLVCGDDDLVDAGETTAFVDIDALGSVSGTKWVDSNGDGVYDQAESTLSGVSIELRDLENNLRDSTSTTTGGAYLFESLATGDYLVCEVVPLGYIQTYPDGCHAFSITDDGEDIDEQNFGNQGQGTIIVIKEVDPDSSSLFDFELSGDLIKTNEFTLGDGDIATMSPLPAGSYSVSEEGDDLYTSVSQCNSSLDNEESATELSLSPGETITCTFTNTRNTGNLEIYKIIDADGDLTTTDDQEPGIGWSMDIDPDGTDTSDPTLGLTDNNGKTSATGLKTGTYWVSEGVVAGYEIIESSCVIGETTTGNGGEGITSFGGVEVQKDETTVCTFYNAPNGTLHGYKWHDLNNDGLENELDTKLSGWTINLYKLNGDVYESVATMDTDSSSEHYGWYWFERLFPGTYKICEENQTGWLQTYPSSNDGCHIVNLPEGDSGSVLGEPVQNATFGLPYNFGNLAYSRVTVTKYSDDNGNGSWDEGEETLSGWGMNLAEDEEIELQETTDESGQAVFANLLPGDYVLSEDLEDGWRQTNITCSSDERQEALLLIDNPLNAHDVQVTAGSEITCWVGNQAEPVLRIQKSNNASGSKNPGDLVTYTLAIDLLSGSNLSEVFVTDLTPDGFSYVPGSWTANKNGAPLSIPEPTYASPGVWELGEMEVGDVITVTYQAKINDNQDGGSYKDIAWAEGSSRGWGSILAQGHSSEYVQDIFVGTDVEVGRINQQTGSVNIEGEVLGASTELPATGVSTFWLVLALSSFFTGLFLIIGGKRMRKLSLSAFLLLASFLGVSVESALAADPDNNLSVRLEQPQSPTRLNEWKLSFSVLDRLARTPSVTCYVKKPGAGSFITFGETFTSSKSLGDSGHCQVSSALLTEQGTYEFYVKASAGADSEDTFSVNVVYDTSGPGTPSSYSKEHPAQCKWIIRFRTADDNGSTSKVEIYSSDQKSFDTHNGTRVGSVNIGSNQDGEFVHDRADHCDREWYYVIRAFDSAGNQSGHAGDQVTITSSMSSPVPALLATSGSGSVLGKDDSQDADSASEEGEILGDIDGEGEMDAEVIEDRGLIDSATTAVKEATQKSTFWWIVITIIALRIIYGFFTRKSR